MQLSAVWYIDCANRASFCTLHTTDTKVCIDVCKEAINCNSFCFSCFDWTNLFTSLTADTANLTCFACKFTVVFVVTENHWFNVIFNDFDNEFWTNFSASTTACTFFVDYSCNTVNNLDCTEWTYACTVAKTETAVSTVARTAKHFCCSNML